MSDAARSTPARRRRIDASVCGVPALAVFVRATLIAFALLAAPASAQIPLPR